MADTLLKVDNINVYYGNIHAVKDISFEVDQGEIVTPVSYTHLNELCHKMDSTRLTTLACYAMCGPFNPVAHITDLVSWNLYLGWYVPGLFLNDLWMDFFHLVYPCLLYTSLVWATRYWRAERTV